MGDLPSRCAIGANQAPIPGRHRPSLRAVNDARNANEKAHDSSAAAPAPKCPDGRDPVVA